jgi:hypothetical protein
MTLTLILIGSLILFKSFGFVDKDGHKRYKHRLSTEEYEKQTEEFTK